VKPGLLSVLHGGEPLFDEGEPEHDLAGDSLGFAHIGLRAGDFSFNALEAFVHRGFETANARVEIADALCPFSATGRQQSEGPHFPVYRLSCVSFALPGA
jgi:hypothetical protein